MDPAVIDKMIALARTAAEAGAPDGTTTVYGPRGQIAHSHAPPTRHTELQ